MIPGLGRRRTLDFYQKSPRIRGRLILPSPSRINDVVASGFRHTKGESDRRIRCDPVSHRLAVYCVFVSRWCSSRARWWTRQPHCESNQSGRARRGRCRGEYPHLGRNNPWSCQLKLTGRAERRYNRRWIVARRPHGVPRRRRTMTVQNALRKRSLLPAGMHVNSVIVGSGYGHETMHRESSRSHNRAAVSERGEDVGALLPLLGRCCWRPVLVQPRSQRSCRPRLQRRAAAYATCGGFNSATVTFTVCVSTAKNPDSTMPPAEALVRSTASLDDLVSLRACFTADGIPQLRTNPPLQASRPPTKRSMLFPRADPDRVPARRVGASPPSSSDH